MLDPASLSRSRSLLRRDAIVLGSSGILGLSLVDLLRLQAASGTKASTRSIINVHLDGGPPQHDTIDPKPDAPVEIRGEFRPISTKLVGFQVSELMPKVASIADRIAFVRSLVGSAGAHDAFQCQSGFPAADLKEVGGRPAYGSVVAKLLSSPADAVPTFVDMMQGRPMVRDSARPGFLGPSFGPFRPDISHLFHRELEAAMKNELAVRSPRPATTLALTDGLTLDRIDHRMKLLSQFDQFRRELDASGSMEAMDRFSAQAVNILTSGRLAKALDLENEPREVLELYTPKTSTEGVQSYTSEDHTAAKKLLLARRLVQSGVRCVSVSFSDFDTHSNNFPRMRNLMPIVDHALFALYRDLESKDMLDQVTVVVWGEFGRTPRINKDGGRDHWPEVGPAMLFGGEIAGGRVVGATDRLGAKVIERPVSYQQVFATLYKSLGIDASVTTLHDPSGRPQHLLVNSEPIRELL